ncbi:MAG: hypothetical protein QOD06_3399 [Candidatus Binatota bacterium]|nr:hypothetical protein [Candidatus Binatota bacterium]
MNQKIESTPEPPATPVSERARSGAASTKARILQSAEEVFAARGFDGASTREIASRAGVNISSLHYHWESKEKLYFAVFRDIYERLVEISQSSVQAAAGEDSRAVHERAIGRIYDFFVANPNLPRLLLRRILEDEAVGEEIEHEILVPAWRLFAGWVKEASGKRIRDIDAQLLMLTVHSALLLFVLDSRQYQAILGGSVREPRIAERVRGHLARLSAMLLRDQLRA